MNDPVTSRIEALESAVRSLTERLAALEQRAVEQDEALRRAEAIAKFVTERRRAIEQMYEVWRQGRGD